MNLETLKLYCDIVRLHSFSKAAKLNLVTQPAASQAMQLLEQTLGAKLFDRRRRPFGITSAGHRYYEGVRHLLTEYAKLETALKEIDTGIGGSVRIASIYSVGLYDFGRHMQRFMGEHPQVKVRLEYLRPNKVYDAVVDEEADIGLLSYPHADRVVTVMPWRSERMVFVCHPSHRLTDRHRVTAGDLEGERFIGFEADLPIRKAIDRCLRQYHSHVNVVMEFDNIETIKQAIEIGAGSAILPEPTIRAEVEARRLVAVPLAMPELVRPVGIIHRRDKPPSSTVQRFIDLLKQSDSLVAR